MNKVVLALALAIVATILSAKLAYNATVHQETQQANQPWTQTTMEFVAWNGEKWTAWIRDGAFEQRPQDVVNWSAHANPSLAYIDWDGQSWQAKIDGGALVLAHRGNWKGTTKRVTAIRYRDWQGKNQLRTLTQLERL